MTESKTTSTFTPDEVAAHRRTWTAALRSGAYLQGHGSLRVSDRRPQRTEPDGTPTYSEFCCLGVAEDKRGCRWRWRTYVPGDETVEHPWGTTDADLGHGQGVTILTEAGRNWLGLATVDPVVVFYDEHSRYWTFEPLSSLNDGGYTPPDVDPDDVGLDPDVDFSWDFARIADAVDAQPADWDGTDAQASARVQELNADRVRP